MKTDTKYNFDFKDKKAKDALKILAVKLNKSMNDLIEDAIKEKYNVYRNGK